MMTPTEIFNEYWSIITLVAGGIWFAWREWKTTRSSDKKVQVEISGSIAERELTYSTRLEERVKRLEIEKELLQKENIELQLKYSDASMSPESILKKIVDNDPGLIWAKRREGKGVYRMVRVSVGYARTYLGGSPLEYDGKLDSEIWDPEIAELFTEDDEKVYASQAGHHVEEIISQSLSGVTGIFKGRKYPIRIGDCDYVIGTGEHTEY